MSGRLAIAMRFVQFVTKSSGTRRLGVQIEEKGGVIDLTAADPAFPSDFIQFLEGGPALWEKAKSVVSTQPTLPFGDVRFLAPLSRPDKVACVGLNYVDHCAEAKKPVPKEPMFFSKFSSTITGPYDDIVLPLVSEEVDWEAELAVVIGKKGKHITQENALDHVFGYTVAHDVSARDWQKKKNEGQFLLGKSMDTFCPIGPAVVAKEALGNPENLKIKCRVNGVTKQDGNTNQLVHGIAKIVSFLSQICTLYPGDIILTGTPPGVGMARNPPEFLKKGDVVECEIEGIGTIRNKIV